MSHLNNGNNLENGLIIPAGSDIIINIFNLGRDSKIFENPHQFMPERFESVDKKWDFAYIPFSAGSRNCIGQKFALLEIKAIISKILRNFEVSLDEVTQNAELKLAFELNLKVKTPIYFILKERRFDAKEIAKSRN